MLRVQSGRITGLLKEIEIIYQLEKKKINYTHFTAYVGANVVAGKSQKGKMR